jgi:signal transduction histidine kinase
MESTTFGIDVAVKDAISLVKAGARDKSIKLSYTRDINVPRLVEGDKYRVMQILTNLLGNAGAYRGVL